MKWNNNYFFYVIFLTSGILLGVFFCNYSYFTFEKTIKFFDLVNLGVTSFIGIYIATKVSRVFTKNNSEKELLMNEVKSALGILNPIISQTDEKELPFRKTVANFKSINEKFLLIEKLIESSHCKGITLKKTRAQFLLARRMITRISPVDDVLKFNSTSYNTSKANLLKLQTELYQLIFEINKK